MFIRSAVIAVLLVGLFLAVASTSTPGPENFGLPEAVECIELVSKVCGFDNACGEEGWCEAARVLGSMDSEGTRCLEALNSKTQYPSCDYMQSLHVAENTDYCMALLDHVCGPEVGTRRPCEAEVACYNAQSVVQMPDAGVPDVALEEGGSIVDLQQRCHEALLESALYPGCRP